MVDQIYAKENPLESPSMTLLRSRFGVSSQTIFRGPLSVFVGM